MRFHNITKDDMLNGDGLRVVLWVAGCSHYCKECQNPITWDPNGGLPFDENAKKEIFEQLDKSYISGITLSGGDPLHPAHRAEIRELMQEIRQKYPNKTIWVYTGYTWNEVKDLPYLKLVDVLVDGPFLLAQRSLELKFCGSRNQRLIDVQASLRQGRVVCWQAPSWNAL